MCNPDNLTPYCLKRVRDACATLQTRSHAVWSQAPNTHGTPLLYAAALFTVLTQPAECTRSAEHNWNMAEVWLRLNQLT